MSAYETEKAKQIWRSVICNRACAGIPTEALEAGVVEKMVEALEGMCWALDELANNLGPGEEMYEVRERARAVLRQIKGDDHG